MSRVRIRSFFISVAILKLEKKLGTPISKDSDPEDNVESSDVESDVLECAVSKMKSKLYKLHPFCVEKTEILIRMFFRLQIVPPESVDASVGVSAFLVGRNTKKNQSVEKFCKMHGLEYRRYSADLELHFRTILIQLGSFAFGKDVVFEDVIQKIRDLEGILSSVDLSELPFTVQKFLVP